MPALPLLAHTLRRASTRLASSAPLPIRSCSKARVLSSAADTCFTSGRVAPPAASPPAPGPTNAFALQSKVELLRSSAGCLWLHVARVFQFASLLSFGPGL